MIRDRGTSHAQKNSEQFRQAQRTCKTLETYWTRAQAGSKDFVIQNGLLYRRIENKVNATQEYALCVPLEFRKELVTLAHNDKSTGHQGIRKPLQRLQCLYFWPKMKVLVANHVKCCSVCQLVKPIQKAERSPLQPLEALDAPAFTHLELDILGGQLPRSKRGNKYVLTLCCRSSRWPFAIALPNLRAKTIADKLSRLFCSIGIPRSLTMDNMPAFQSDLFKQWANDLGIDLKFSMPLHAISHGQIEKTNSVLEQMIRKFIFQYKANWCDLLPYLLFSIRTSRNESTNFSPDLLVLGHRMRTLLDVQKDSWEKGDKVQHTLKIPAIQFMYELKERVESALDAARVNTLAAQARAKRCYDRHSSERKLDENDLVLILEPNSNNKLFAQWTGPGRIVSRLGNNNYLVKLGHKTVKIHVNSLREYFWMTHIQTQHIAEL